MNPFLASVPKWLEGEEYQHSSQLFSDLVCFKKDYSPGGDSRVTRGSQMRHSEPSGGRISVTTHQRAVWVAQPPSPGRVGCGFPAPDSAPQSCGRFHLEASPQQHAKWVSTKGRWRSVIARARRTWDTKSRSFNNYRGKENKQQNLEIYPPALSDPPSQPCPTQTPWLVGARN